MRPQAFYAVAVIKVLVNLEKKHLQWSPSFSKIAGPLRKGIEVTIRKA